MTIGRILLVDHSRGALLFQETILRRRDTIVMTSLSGTDGLEKAKESQPHLIVFGFDLFDMNAPEFCREIREAEATKSISLLLVCDREAAHHADLCLGAGCNDVIYRPLQRHELDAKVEKLTAIPVRRQLRTITKIEVSLEKNGRFVLGRSMNISASGMLLEVDKMLPGEGAIRLHFYLPGDPRPMQLRAEVLRADFSGGTPRYGVKFVDVQDDEKTRIDRYVTRLRSRELL
jgi:response regulator RpfG family c-di-GMP phosphodiesterase